MNPLVTDAIIATKDEEIARLKVELEKMRARAEGLTDILGERDKTIKELLKRQGKERS